MKAEERHELKENDLVGWLQYGLPVFLRQNGSYLLLIVALGFLGWQLWSIHERNQALALQSAWADLNSIDARPPALLPPPSTNPAELKLTENPAGRLMDVIDHYENKAVKSQAMLELGDYYLQCVVFNSYPAKLDQKDALARAEETFSKALSEFGSDLLVAGKAHLGLAAVAQDRGDWDEAKKQYQILSDKNGPFKDTPFVDFGAAKLSSLEQWRHAPDLAALVPQAAAESASKTPSFLPESGAGGDLLKLPGMWSGTSGVGTGGSIGPESPIGPPAPLLFPPLGSSPTTAPASAPG